MLVIVDANNERKEDWVSIKAHQSYKKIQKNRFHFLSVAGVSTVVVGGTLHRLLGYQPIKNFVNSPRGNMADVDAVSVGLAAGGGDLGILNKEMRVKTRRYALSNAPHCLLDGCYLGVKPREKHLGDEDRWK